MRYIYSADRENAAAFVTRSALGACSGVRRVIDLPNSASISRATSHCIIWNGFGLLRLLW